MAESDNGKFLLEQVNVFFQKGTQSIGNNGQTCQGLVVKQLYFQELVIPLGV